MDFPVLYGRVFATARDRAGSIAAARPACDRHRKGGTEVFGNLHQFFRAGDRNQPHHQKESHHRCHKVSVSNFPRTAVMPSAVLILFLAYNNDWMALMLHTFSSSVCF